jgi:hypothetical protein
LELGGYKKDAAKQGLNMGEINAMFKWGASVFNCELSCMVPLLPLASGKYPESVGAVSGQGLWTWRFKFWQVRWQITTTPH